MAENFSGKRPQTVCWEKRRRSQQPPLQNAGAFSTRTNVYLYTRGLNSPEKSVSRILGCFRWQDPCLDMPYPIRSAGSLQSPSARILYRTLAQDPCVEILYKTHVSGSLTRSKRQNLSTGTMCVEPLQSTCARAMRHDLYGSMPAGRQQDPYLNVPGFSTRSMPPVPLTGSMCPDPCLSILNCESSTRAMSLWLLYLRSMSLESTSATLLEDPCLRGVATRGTKTDTALQRARFDAQETRRGLRLQT